jgi:alkyl sulfatase BDS1-like metallo-beta-lactamase superfamily hydrolase
LTDNGARLAMSLQNCTMTYVLDSVGQDADVTVRISRAALVDINIRKTDVAAAVAAGDVRIDGDRGIIEQLFALLDDFTMMFDVVAPSLPD